MTSTSLPSRESTTFSDMVLQYGQRTAALSIVLSATRRNPLGRQPLRIQREGGTQLPHLRGYACLPRPVLDVRQDLGDQRRHGSHLGLPHAAGREGGGPQSDTRRDRGRL